MNNIVHMLVLRKDLNLSVGQIGAQCAHLGAAFFMDKASKEIALSKTEKAWLDGPVVLLKSVNNFEELEYVRERAEQLHIPCLAWEDTIFSENIGTSITLPIGLSLGPADSDKLKEIGNLQLYN